MDLSSQRRLEFNLWVVKARWFYMGGVFLIGVIAKTISQTNVYFPLDSMAVILAVFIVINLSFHLAVREIRRDRNISGLEVVSWSQIAVELAGFTLIMHLAGGVESISPIFFFLPIVSASLLIGSQGAVITSFLSALSINSLVLVEYFGYIRHIPRYGMATIEFQNLSLALTKTITISIFFAIVALFSGLGVRLLFRREQALETKSAELAKSKEKTDAIIADFDDPVVFIDNENRIDIFNRAARKFLGLKKSDRGRKVPGDNVNLDNFRDIFRVDFTSRCPADIISGQKLEEISLYHKRYSYSYKVRTASVCGPSGQCFGRIKIFTDITREKMIDRIKSDFIGIAAHQMRTPLTAVKWMVQSLKQELAPRLSKEEKEVLHRIYISNNRMIELIVDLLYVVRIEEGRFEFEFSFENISVPVKELKDEYKKALKKKNLDMKIYIEDDLPEIKVDKEKIKLALRHFIDNAIKYTPDNGIISVSLSRQNEYIKISVKDQGIGIPEKEINRLYSKFFRATNAKRVETEGNGLGLYIARNIINKHYGRVYVESKEGHGTNFVISLPITEAGRSKRISN